MEKSKFFNHFIKNVKVGHLKAIRQDILEQCDVSLTAYSKWVHGTATPRKKNQQTINYIAHKYGYETVY